MKEIKDLRHIERWIDRIVLVSIYILLFYYFKPSLIFSETTVSGGDTGAHHYIAKYMGDFLLPHGRLSGWAPGWYAGIPMLYFYFPIGYLLIALVSYIIPYQIAFKLITILGIFLLPVALYLCMRWCGFSFPLPATVVSLSLPLLFLESHSIFGGNIPSTLAGEFSFSIGFALSFFFIGLIHKGIRENRFWILNGVLLSFIVLFHILPVIVLVISMPFFVFYSKKVEVKVKGIKNNIIYLVKVFTLGFCLSGFWSVPFLANLPYIAHMK